MKKLGIGSHEKLTQVFFFFFFPILNAHIWLILALTLQLRKTTREGYCRLIEIARNLSASLHPFVCNGKLEKGVISSKETPSFCTCYFHNL